MTTCNHLEAATGGASTSHEPNSQLFPTKKSLIFFERAALHPRSQRGGGRSVALDRVESKIFARSVFSFLGQKGQRTGGAGLPAMINTCRR